MDALNAIAVLSIKLKPKIHKYYEAVMPALFAMEGTE